MNVKYKRGINTGAVLTAYDHDPFSNAVYFFYAFYLYPTSYLMFNVTYNRLHFYTHQFESGYLNKVIIK
mgnify:CR=1 FL=1